MDGIHKKVKAVITDPPYMLNIKNDKAGKLNPWTNYCNSAYWYAAWMSKARNKLKDDGCMWTFLNWKSLITFQKAAHDIEWPIESLLVWDKEWIGPGGHKGLRPSYELVALFAMPGFAIKNRGIADVQRFKWTSKKPNGHPAEKPEKLIKWLIEISTEPGDTVLDMFMGSGTTGVAALACDRKFIGIEQDVKWFSVAEQRIAEFKKLKMI
jgi:DNA modification methylase